jgi:hypothetical protein
MKTWIENNQTLAIVIGLLILAGLIYLLKFLANKYINTTVAPAKPKNTNPTSIGTSGTGIVNPNASSRVGGGAKGAVTTAGAGMRVGGGAKGAR